MSSSLCHDRRPDPQTHACHGTPASHGGWHDGGFVQCPPSFSPAGSDTCLCKSHGPSWILCGWRGWVWRISAPSLSLPGDAAIKIHYRTIKGSVSHLLIKRQGVVLGKGDVGCPECHNKFQWSFLQPLQGGLWCRRGKAVSPRSTPAFTPKRLLPRRLHSGVSYSSGDQWMEWNRAAEYLSSGAKSLYSCPDGDIWRHHGTGKLHATQPPASHNALLPATKRKSHPSEPHPPPGLQYQDPWK